ncbi:serine hydrolase domain-containing protein [Chamaesiphon sp.]|uniref:serine hydrolase domain-containing protein n=1 Tax=Chamaesiphon sp. TaxID=2814140 RepID=UPI0035948509
MENRIDRIIANLRAGTIIKGKFAAPAKLKDRMRYYHTPGVSIAVINNFEIEWAHGFGFSYSRSQYPATAKTIFQSGSISKAVFALGLMRLVQEGRLSLDEDVNRYLTTWRIPTDENGQPKITLRQILSHIAGFTVHGFPGYLASESYQV